MNIEELRKAAENKDGWVNYLHEQDFADYLSEVEDAGDGGEIIVDARDLEELVRRARHSNALPALQAECARLAASEAEMREALNGVWALRDKHGKLWALLMNALQASPSPRAAAYQAARDRFEAALAMAVGKGERHDA